MKVCLRFSLTLTVVRLEYKKSVRCSGITKGWTIQGKEAPKGAKGEGAKAEEENRAELKNAELNTSKEISSIIR